MRRRVRPVLVVVPPLPVVADDAIERVLEVGHELGIDALVDRDAGRGVRDVDERRRGAVRPAERVADLLGDLDQLRLALGLRERSRARVYPTNPHGGAAPARRDRRAQRGGRPLHRRARRGGVPPLRRPQGDVRHRADLRAPREPDASSTRHSRSERRSTATAAGASCGSSRARAISATSSASEEERVAELEATLTATVDGEEIPFRMLRPRLMNEEDRAVRERIERGEERAHRGAPEPAPAPGCAGRPTRDTAARRRQLRRPLPELRPARSTTSPSSAGASSPTRRTSGRRPATGSSARASASGSARSSAGTSGRAWRGVELGRRVPARPDAAGARGHARRSRASTSARRRTSSSTSRTARTRIRARSARRSRCPAAWCS